MDVPIIQCYTHDGRFAPTSLATHRMVCFHGTDKRRRPYGDVMWAAWQRYKDCDGMIWVEGDVCIEPLHIAEMRDLYSVNPDAVVAVPFRLYPASTGNNGVYWPFYVETPNCGERILRAEEPIPLYVRSFGLGCTYLPRALFAVLSDTLRETDWPSLDWRLSIAARTSGINIMTTRTPAVHLHY